ncbi:DUF2510 domain-containing protein [Microbacterium sp.]|uniref:DUF2510 domain-containing protein n=1 Tax=Microbacterium sp. TaxID=51671 RepID=UPI0035673B55
MTTPAGWYDDGSGRQRWWDGSGWTQHTVESAPPAPQAESAPVPDSSAPVQAAPEQNALSSAPSEQPFVAPHVWQAPSPAADAGVDAYPRADGPSAMPQNPYPWSGQPGAHPSHTAPAQAKNRVSILGIIGLAVVVVGVVLSCIPVISVIGWVLLGAGFVASLVSLFLPGMKWPGITGLALGVVGSVLAIGVGLLSLGMTGLASPTPSPSATAEESEDPSADGGLPEGTETVPIGDLEVGHCLPLIEWDEEIYELPIVPCDQPHTDEVYLIFDAPDGEFPGDDELQRLATEKCDAGFATFVGVPYEESELDNYWFVPTEGSWNRWNDRAIQCIAVSYEEITGTLEGAAR